MARPDHLESKPITRQGKSAGGFSRGLPNLGAHGAELKIHLNGQFTSDDTPEEIRTYLLPTTVYGSREDRTTIPQASRNFRSPMKF